MLLRRRSVVAVVLIALIVIVFGTNNTPQASSSIDSNRLRKNNDLLGFTKKHVAANSEKTTPNHHGEETHSSSILQRARNLEDASPGFDPLGSLLGAIIAIGRAVQSFLSFITFGLIPAPAAEDDDPGPTTTPVSSPTSAPVSRQPVVLTKPSPFAPLPTAAPTSAPVTRQPVVLTKPSPFAPLPTASPTSAPVTRQPVVLTKPSPFAPLPTASPTSAPVKVTPQPVFLSPYSGCLRGDYEDDAGGCISCPDNSDSTPGATSIRDCKCNGGYVKEADGTCRGCPANTVEVGGGCEPCLPGLTSPAASTAEACSGCGDGVVDPAAGEECDDGYRNGDPFLSDCTATCTITDNPRGCCISADQCINDVLESECVPGTFDAFGVCDPFSPVCMFEDVPSESLCGDNPEECIQDNIECVTAECNTVSDQCEYTTEEGFDPASGGCVPPEEEELCSTDPTPCPKGQVESTGSCSCQCCRSDQFESEGECYDCPQDTTSQAGSADISSCIVPEGDVCPVETPAPTCPVAASSPSPGPPIRKAARSRRLGICDDECSPLNSQQNIQLEGVQMKAFFSPVSPGTVADLVGAAEALGLLGNLANVANVAAGATQSASAALLEASKAFIDSNTSGNLASACIQGALNLGKLLMCRDGAAIWIKLSGECCVSTNCCIFWSNNEWVEKEVWHKCSAQPRHGIGGFRKGDSAKVKKALPGCIVEAVQAFSCP